MDRLPREGWEALAAADWPTARRSFEEALAESESAEALDGLSQALQFQCEYDAAIEVKERAFAAYRREGRPADAADTARWLAFLHGTSRGTSPSASGWMGARREPARGRRGVRRARLADPRRRRVHARRRRSASSAPRRRWRSPGASATPTSSSRRSRCSGRPRSRPGASPRACSCSTRRWRRSRPARWRRTARCGRDLLPAAQRLRARHGRRRAEEWMALATARRVGRLRASHLPDALRRDPRRAGPLGRGRDGASLRDRDVRARLSRRRRLPARPARRAAGAPGALRGGGAPARGRGVASARRAGPRR